MKNIFYIETIYSLLIVLIMKPNLEENLYFFSDDFSQEIVNKFKNKIILKKSKKNIKLIRYYKVRKFLKGILKENKEKLKGGNFFLQDHLTYSQFFLNNFENKFFLIEDGVRNYTLKILEEESNKKKKIFLYKYMNIIKKYYPAFGLSEKIQKIYLTGILPIPNLIESKVKIVNIENLWNNLLGGEQEKILDIFNIKIEKIKNLNKLKNKILLITQPLSEDRVITEQEKIKFYREIIEKQNVRKIYIKAHPREKTNYKEVFKNFNIEVIENTFPIELFLLLNIKFDKVITLFSTGALNFKGKAEVEFIGTEKYPKLYERFGKIEMK